MWIEWRYISWRVQFLNWLVQRVVYGKKLPFSLHFTSRIVAPENMTIGPGVDISLGLNGNMYIQAKNGIVVEEGTFIGPGVSLISANHRGQHDHTLNLPIRIGAHSQLGAGCTILPGVRLADYTIVGAGAVVTKSCTIPNSTLVGVPAKVVKHGC